MANNLVAWDAVNGRYTRSTLTESDVGGFIEAVYTTTVPTTNFEAPPGSTITSTNTVVVDRNGQRLFEGASEDFQREIGNNRVATTYAIPAQSKVRVRVYAG